MRSLSIYALVFSVLTLSQAAFAQTNPTTEPSPTKHHSMVALIAPQLYRVLPGEKNFLSNHSFHIGSTVALFYQSNDNAAISFRTGLETGYRENSFSTLAQPNGYFSETCLQIPVLFHLRYPLYRSQNGTLTQWALTGGLYYQVIAQRTEYTLDPGTGNTINTDRNLPYGRAGSTAAFSVTLQSPTNSLRHEVGIRANTDFKNQQAWKGGVDYHPAYTAFSLYYALVVPARHHR